MYDKTITITLYCPAEDELIVTWWHLMESDAHCNLDSMKLASVQIWNKIENTYSSTHVYIF